MGKRPRISKSDLPNPDRVSVLGKMGKVLDNYIRLVEKRKEVESERERMAINSSLKGLRYDCQQLLGELKLVDLSCKNEVESLFNRYCESYNIYFGRQLKNYVTQTIQSEEVKKITHLIHKANSEEDKAKLQEYIDAKPQSELNALIKLAVNNYQKNRSDYNRKKTNSFLAYFHKKVECKPYTKATEDEIKATRADFNGFFQIPSAAQLKCYNPYSKEYQKFCAMAGKQKKEVSPFAYNLQDCPAWKACLNTTMLGSMEMELRHAMGKQGIPPQIVSHMKVADFGRILFNQYGKESYNPSRGNKLAFRQVLPGLDSRHKEFFWKNNAIPTPESQEQFCKSLLNKGVSQEYIDLLLPSILKKGCPNPKVDRKNFKGVIPYFSVHHKWAIQYLGGNANNQKNYVAIAEFKTANDLSDATPQHDIWHEADATIRKAFGQLGNGDQLYEEVPSSEARVEDYIEYLVDTRYDNQNDGKHWTVSMGYKPEDNIRVEVKDFSVSRTNPQTSLKRGQSVDKGYRPTAYAR